MTIDNLIFKHKDLEVKMPKELEPIFEVIKNSKSILDLKDDWDDNGSGPIEENIWRDSIKFLSEYSIFIYKNYKKIIYAPEINPLYPDSIDLDFRIKRNQDKIEMLINLKKENSKTIIEYYGDFFNEKTKKIKNEIEGKMNTNKIHKPLLEWMAKYLTMNKADL